MKMTMKLDSIDYGDVAVKVLPALQRSAGSMHGAAAKTIAAIAMLPENLIRDIFGAIPTEQKNGIIAAYVTEYKDGILRLINKLSDDHKIGVTLADCLMDPKLTITAEVGRIDYICVAERFLPVIKEKLLGMGGFVAMLRPVIQRASAEQLCGLLDQFVGDNKDAFLASLFNQNQKMLIAVIEAAAEKQNVRLRISSVFVEV